MLRRLSTRSTSLSGASFLPNSILWHFISISFPNDSSLSLSLSQWVCVCVLWEEHRSLDFGASWMVRWVVAWWDLQSNEPSRQAKALLSIFTFRSWYWHTELALDWHLVIGFVSIFSQRILDSWFSTYLSPFLWGRAWMIRDTTWTLWRQTHRFSVSSGFGQWHNCLLRFLSIA